MTDNSYSGSIYLGDPSLKTNMFKCHSCQTAGNLNFTPNGLLFSTPTQPRISFERMIKRPRDLGHLTFIKENVFKSQILI
jgi:hypothetical protein